MSQFHLILWRHAEAEEGFPDHVRALTERGHRQARQVAHWLKTHLPLEPRILVSPAQRTQQTASAFSRHFETVPHLGTHARPRDLLQACAWPAPTDPYTLLVGHQPTLGETAAWLMTGEPAPWSVRKGALWWLTQRERNGQPQLILRAVIDPELI